jgi:predicted phage tail protein
MKTFEFTIEQHGQLARVERITAVSVQAAKAAARAVTEQMPSIGRVTRKEIP